MSATWDAWTFRNEVGGMREGASLVGFKVHATDGDIGKVDEATLDVGASRIVVDTGPWIFGRKVLLPAGTVQRVDWDDESVYVDLTKGQIKDSPELDEGADLTDAGYRDRVGGYYSGIYSRGMPPGTTGGGI
ncbi:PRC-barrel domain-containing protein [Georgenia daeguensis]|uniref:PRC-barrel domain-containing protein n=1 Tax=Georgenia daeguensis TaxID=908355 RepID=A0ABP8EU97_9MICO